MVGGIPFVAGVNTIFSDDVSTSVNKLYISVCPCTYTYTHAHTHAQSLEGNNVTGPNKRDSIRVLSAVVFLVGVCQMLFWTVALFQK